MGSRNSERRVNLFGVAGFILTSTLAFAGGGTNFVWNGSAGADDWFDGENWTPSVVGGPGPGDTATINISDTVDVSGNVDAEVAFLNLSNGTLTGNATITVTGNLNWTGGTMAGSGNIVILNGALFNISGGSSGRTVNTRTVNNAGTTVFEPGTTVSMGQGAVFNNQVGALFDMKSNAVFDYTTAGGVPQFNNLGTLRKSAGTGTSTIDIPVNSSSPVEVQTGTLSLTLGGASSGNFTVSSGAVLHFGGGTHTITLGDGESISAAGRVRFSAGTTSIGGAGDYNVTGNTEVTGGTVNFNGVATTVNALLSGGTLGGSGTLSVTGNLDWTGGNFGGSGNLDIANTATLNIGREHEWANAEHTHCKQCGDDAI